MNKILLNIFIILSSIYSVQADSNKDHLYEGFIIISENDTIFGKIKFINRIHNELKVDFIDSKGKKHTYKPSDLIEYAFNHSKISSKTYWIHYFRKRIKEEDKPIRKIQPYRTIFLQRIVEGKVSVYIGFSTVPEEIAAYSEKRIYYVENKHLGGGFKRITKAEYRTYLEDLVAANSDLSEKLGKNGYGYNYLPKVVKMHNDSLGN